MDSIEQNRLSDEELGTVSGGYVVKDGDKYFVVDDLDGKKVPEQEPEGYDKLEHAQMMAALNHQSSIELTVEEWDRLMRGNGI